MPWFSDVFEPPHLRGTLCPTYFLQGTYEVCVACSYRRIDTRKTHHSTSCSSGVSEREVWWTPGTGERNQTGNGVDVAFCYVHNVEYVKLEGGIWDPEGTVRKGGGHRGLSRTLFLLQFYVAHRRQRGHVCLFGCRFISVYS